MSVREYATDKLSTVLSYSSSGGLIVFGVALSDWALLVGIVCTISTFLVNWYYKAKYAAKEAVGIRISPLD